MQSGSHPFSIRLKPAPALMVAVFAAHVAAGMALFCMHLPFAFSAPFALLIFVSVARAVRAQTLKHGLSFTLADDGALWLHRKHGEGGAGCAASDVWTRVLPGTVLFPAVVWFALAWTEPGGRQRRLRLMLIAAEVEEVPNDNGRCGQWRRLRTWLRYRATAAGAGRSDSPSRTDDV